MRIYVWDQREVLKDYSGGLVVVISSSEQSAWEALKAHDLRAYWCLKTGESCCFTEADGQAAEVGEGFPINPRVLSLTEEHVFVKWGGA